MEEPPQQGGPVQQFFWEQPARVSHSAQLSPGKPMALSSNSCKLPGFSSFWSFYYCYLKRSFAFPPKHPIHLGDFFVFCLLITAEDTCCQPLPPPEHCTALSESFLFVLSYQYLPRCRLRNQPFTALAWGNPLMTIREKGLTSSQRWTLPQLLLLLPPCLVFITYIAHRQVICNKRNQSISSNRCLLSWMNNLEIFSLREMQHLNYLVLVISKVFVKPTTSFACALWWRIL